MTTKGEGLSLSFGQKILIFDGAMGTEIEKAEVSAKNRWRPYFPGCNELLVETQPELIAEIHARYLEAGADVIETNTFGGAQHVLAEHGLAGHCYALNRAAARIGREQADRYSTRRKPRFVAGSIGPGSRLPGLEMIGFEQLQESYRPQVQGLLDGGVDCLIVETCQDLLQAKAALAVIQDVFAGRNKGQLTPQNQTRRHIGLNTKTPRHKEEGRNIKYQIENIKYQIASSVFVPSCLVPVMVQVTVDAQGNMLMGSDIETVLAALEPLPVAAIGLNCGVGPKGMMAALRYLSEHSSKLLSLMPNAGMPKLVAGRPRYTLSPQAFARQMRQFALEPGLNVAGGCCGTTPEHIRALAETLAGVKPRRPARYVPRLSSQFQAQELDVRPKPLIVGERANASGSRQFRARLMNDDLAGMARIANLQEKDGAQLIDVSVACAGRNELEDMARLGSKLNSTVRLPVMIDSTRPDVIETALQRLAGRCVVNSINLEAGEERAKRVIELCRRYGAALVGLTIDRQGMALTAARKLQVAERLYRLAVNEGGLRPDSLFLDFLTFTLGSGAASLRNAGRETLTAIRAAKRRWPECFTILGVSNVSHGLAPEIRKVLNSAFLTRAIEHGLDAAIVHAGQIQPLNQLNSEAIGLCDDLVFNRPHGKVLPLERLLGYFARKIGTPPVFAAKTVASLFSPVQRLRRMVLEGNDEGLNEVIAELRKRRSALCIVERHLLPAMSEVGKLFERGRMQLPFVLRSAEVTSRAFALLRENRDATGFRGENGSVPIFTTPLRKPGILVLATVRGDVHDIGKNLVDLILSSNGFRVVNLGVRQPPGPIVAAARKYRADAIGLSGLLVESARAMKEYLEVFANAGLRIPVICGGAALRREFVARELQPVYPGSVFYARDALAGLRIMEQLTRRGRNRGK
jgi:5-methyltetrahydrofolate--homocysteine methyltransferase